MKTKEALMVELFQEEAIKWAKMEAKYEIFGSLYDLLEEYRNDSRVSLEAHNAILELIDKVRDNK